MTLPVQFNALSYIQTIAQLVQTPHPINEPNDTSRDPCWKCSPDHQHVIFNSSSPIQPIQSKYTFDVCMDPSPSPSSAISKTNLHSLLYKAFEGHHIGILSLGMGSKTDTWRHQWMNELISHLKTIWTTCSKDRKIEFSFCILGLKDNDILDYSTLEVLPMHLLLERNLSIEDLLIRSESDDPSIDPLHNLLTLVQRPLFVCTLLMIYYYVEFNDRPGEGYNGSIRLCDLGHFGQDHLQSGLDAIKEIALLLQQPYLSTDLPYDKHALTWLLSDCIGGKSQCCLTLHIDDHHSDEYSIQAAKFCELIRTIKTHPFIDIEYPFESNPTHDQCETINNLVMNVLTSYEKLKILYEEQSLLLESKKLEKILENISLKRSQRELEFSEYQRHKETIDKIESEIAHLYQQIENMKSIQSYDTIYNFKLLMQLETRIKDLESRHLQEQKKLESSKQQLNSKEEELKRFQNQNLELESKVNVLSKVREELSSQLKQINSDSSQTIQLIKNLESEMQKERGLYLDELKSIRHDSLQLSKQRDNLLEELNSIKQQLNPKSPEPVQKKRTVRKKKESIEHSSEEPDKQKEVNITRDNLFATSSFVPIAKPKAIHQGDVSDENTSFLTNLSFHSNEEQNTNTLRQFTKNKSSTSDSFPQDKPSILSNIMAGFHVKSIK